MFSETKIKSARRWFVVCKQYQPYPLTEIRRELQQQRDDLGDQEHDIDEFEMKKRHLEPTDFEVGRHLIDLGKLAEFQIHQAVKPELARFLFKLAGLYHWGHPTEQRRFYVALNSAAVADMEQNAYRFFFVPEDRLLDFWFEDASDLDDDDEKRAVLARQTDSIRYLTGDDLSIGFNSFYSLLANSVRRHEDVADDLPVLKAAAAAVLDAAAICRDADIPFDDGLESDWTFARLDYANRPAGEIATAYRAYRSGAVAEVEWSCNYDIMLRRLRDGFDDYENFHAPTQERRFLVGTVLKDLLLDETDNVEALRLIRIILASGKNAPPTGANTGIDRSALQRIATKYAVIFGNYRSESNGEHHNGYFLRPPYDGLLPRIIDLMESALTDMEVLATIEERADVLVGRSSFSRLFRHADLFLDKM